MRHGKKFNHLSRKKGHRHAMLSNMASSLIMHKRIFTTTAKAKALRGFVEPLITKSKDNTTHSRRTVFSYLKDKEALNELYSTVAPKVAERPGGYTRILKTHNRLVDNADMCMMELVDFNDLMLEAKAKASTAKSGSKRTRRGKKGASEKTAAPELEETKEVVAEEVEAATTEAVEEAIRETEAKLAEDTPEAEIRSEDVAEEAPETVSEEVVEETAEAIAEEAEETDEVEAQVKDLAEPSADEVTAEAEPEVQASETPEVSEETSDAEETPEEPAAEDEAEDSEEEK
jgi:large subunit ribosomal protein L17